MSFFFKADKMKRKSPAFGVGSSAKTVFGLDLLEKKSSLLSCSYSLTCKFCFNTSYGFDQSLIRCRTKDLRTLVSLNNVG